MHFVVTFVSVFFELMIFALLARVIFSWLSPKQRSSRVYFMLCDITDPILNPIKRVLPATGMIDFSPLIALIALSLLKDLILSFLT